MFALPPPTGVVVVVREKEEAAAGAGGRVVCIAMHCRPRPHEGDLAPKGGLYIQPDLRPRKSLEIPPHSTCIARVLWWCWEGGSLLLLRLLLLRNG
jgi:hypothetical protein